MISINEVTLRRGVQVVLDQASATVSPGEKVALVGLNGAGKSSLFGLLTGALIEDSGGWTLPESWRIMQVEQRVPDSDLSATEFVVQGDKALQQAKEQLAQAERDDDGEAMAHAHMAMQDAGAYDATARAQQLLMGLGFTVEQVDAAVNTFSGGWKMRLQLARALMAPSDLLLLDEPTNHLDMDALVWLEGWLQHYAGTLVIISHDRDFLDAVVKVTLHLQHGKLQRYTGNYSAFELQYAQQMELQQAAYAKQQDKIAHLQKFIDRFKAKATKAKQAQSRVKALERMEKVAPVLTASSFSFAFAQPVALPNPMLSVDGVAIGYGDAPVLQNVQFSVLPGQRIGILGANGQGKSTLVKAIAGELDIRAGKMTQGKHLRIGYFAQQEMDILHSHDTPLVAMQRLARERGAELGGVDDSEQALRTFLGSFRFVDDAVHQAVDTMSGGERARLVMAMMVWLRPNLLLLDEPTNHLDLVTREALALALNDFDGTVMLVSHDRALLRATCEEYWLVSDGAVKSFEGDLQAYQVYLAQQEKLRQSAAQARVSAQTASQSVGGDVAVSADVAAPAVPKLDRKARAEQRAKLQPLKKEQKRIDTQMEKLRAEQEQLHADLIAQTVPASDMAQVQKRLAQIDSDVEELEMRWLELEEEMEAM